MHAWRANLAAIMCILLVADCGSGADKDQSDEPLPRGAKLRLGTMRYRVVWPARGNIQRLALSHDGRVIAVLDGRSILTLLETKTGKTLRKFEMKDFPVGADQMAFVRGPEAVAFWSMRGFTVTETTNGKTLAQVPYLVSPTHNNGSITPDGNRAVLVREELTKDRVEVRDIAKDRTIGWIEPLQTYRVHTALSADGRILATWGDHVDDKPVVGGARKPAFNQIVQVWDVDTQKERIRVNVEGHDKQVSAAALSPDGKVVALSATGSSGVLLLDATTGRPVKELAGKASSGTKLIFSPDGKWIAVLADDGVTRVWDIASGKQVASVESPIKTVAGLVFTANDRAIAFGSISGTIFLWEIPSGKDLTPVNLHAASVSSIAFHKDGKTILTAGDDGQWIEWDRDHGTTLRAVLVRHLWPTLNPDEKAAFGPLGLSGDGEHVVMWPPPRTIFAEEGKAIVYQRKTGREIVSIDLPGEPTPGMGAIFSLDGRLIICSPGKSKGLGTEDRLHVFDVVSGARISELVVPTGTGQVAFSPDGSRVVIAQVASSRAGDSGWESLITGWDVKTGRKLGEVFIPNESVSMSIAAVDNSSAIIASNKRVWGVDFEAGRMGVEIDRFQFNELAVENQDRTPSPVVFNSDGTLVAIGVPTHEDNFYGVRIYDAKTGDKLHTFLGHHGPITAIRFSPDGKLLASGSRDTTVLLWDMSLVKKPNP
jgi:WD40 repeat protein